MGQTSDMAVKLRDDFDSRRELESTSDDIEQNRWRGPFNAWFFTTFDRYINYISSPNKDVAFDRLTGSTILEIGSGVGANLAYVPSGAKLIAIEPNEAMHDRLRQRSASARVELEIVTTSASSIPLADSSIDDVICSLVLCTVEHPAATLAEVRRVLRPGGRFRFVEHVIAPNRGPRRLIQRILRRPWSWVFEGCQLDRDTAKLLDEAGFTTVTTSRRKPRMSIFWP
ncbi:MAG: class I SAM-dependent methyltransferase, partial [Actinomycetia bacterium]|nr:class I SAM-dependent methyltransferase [Actinomycetes bacterium]